MGGRRRPGRPVVAAAAAASTAAASSCPVRKAASVGKGSKKRGAAEARGEGTGERGERQELRIERSEMQRNR